MHDESVILREELYDWKSTSEICGGYGLSEDFIENVSIEGFDSS